jgi:hypothetical protein
VSARSEGAVGEGDMVSSVEVEGGLRARGKATVEGTLCPRSEPRRDDVSGNWDSSALMAGNVAWDGAAAAAGAARAAGGGRETRELYCHSWKGMSVGKGVWAWCLR